MTFSEMSLMEYYSVGIFYFNFYHIIVGFILYLLILPSPWFFGFSIIFLEWRNDYIVSGLLKLYILVFNSSGSLIHEF